MTSTLKIPAGTPHAEAMRLVGLHYHQNICGTCKHHWRGTQGMSDGYETCSVNGESESLPYGSYYHSCSQWAPCVNTITIPGRR